MVTVMFFNDYFLRFVSFFRAMLFTLKLPSFATFITFCGKYNMKITYYFKTKESQANIRYENMLDTVTVLRVSK